MNEPRLQVVSARNHPFNFVISLKVGSTFLRNLVYYLDHGTPYSQVERDFPKDLLKRELTREELARGVSFFVVRDPVDRFFSLYFDKAIGSEEARFPWLREVLIKNRVFHEGPDWTIAQHRENCDSLLAYVSLRVRGKLKNPINHHWSKQIIRLENAIKFGLKPLLLEDLENQLLTIADGRIDGLEEAINSVTTRNRSPRPVQKEDILTPELQLKIDSLYAEDTQLYELVKAGWSLLGRPPEIEL